MVEKVIAAAAAVVVAASSAAYAFTRPAEVEKGEPVIIEREPVVSYTFQLYDEPEYEEEAIEEVEEIIEEPDEEPLLIMEEKAVLEIGKEVAIPTEFPTNVKFMTDYHFYNITGSPNNRLQLASYTDEYGLRRFNDDYVVGLGSYYTVDIGERFRVTLDTGKEFTIILGDTKPDCENDPTHRYRFCPNYMGQDRANIIEFIIDVQNMPAWLYEKGSVDYVDDLNGSIVKMVYIGRDASQNWDWV